MISEAPISGVQIFCPWRRHFEELGNRGEIIPSRDGGADLVCFDQLARDVGGVNVGGVKGMLSDIRCMSCAKLCTTCAFLLQSTVFYITFERERERD